MRKLYLPFILLFAFTQASFAQIISQYIETSSGSYPKGIEIWNNTGSTLDFVSNNLVIEKGTNGGAPAMDYTLSSGTLTSGSVIVIGTDQDTQTDTGFRDFVEANGTVFYTKAFTFNGDDALVVKYDGVTTDVFGDPGTGDPGTGWAGSGVQTYNQNISLKVGITTGDTDGWTDPSTRFEITTTDNSLTGFGLAPVIYPEPTNYATNFSATENGSSQIDLAWTDAIGAQLPWGYLIKLSAISYASISTPIDGIPEIDGSSAVNVVYGVEAYNWAGLAASTDYYYKIYPYTNSGSNINYKTDGLIPGATATTSAFVIPDLVINEIHADPDAVNGDANGDGIAGTIADEFVEIINTTTNSIDLTNYTLADGIGVRHTFPSSTIVPVGESIVIFGGGTPTGIPGTAQVASTGALGLNNTGDVVTLANASLVIIDTYTFGSEGGDNQSLGRNPDITGGFVKHSTITTNPVLFSPGKKNDDGSALPVELISFTATVMTKGMMLNWSTATEVNNYGFSIERKSGIDNRKWNEISFVEGHGNSNSPKDYTYVDNSQAIGEVSYRLKQIDIDGAFEYSDVVRVTSTNLAKYELYQNHPNPFNPSTVISFTLPELSYVNITVYNTIGQKVMELVNEQMDAGFHNVNFDCSSLSSGFYFYRLETPNYSKTMKMILLR